MTTTPLAHFDVAVARKGVVMEANGDPREVEGVLNPASARSRNGELLLYPRCVGAGNVSRIGLARWTDAGDPSGFERLGYVLEPEAAYELRPESHGGMGCEDPRVTFIDVLDRYVMTYTAFGLAGPRIALALSDDGYLWERLGLVDFNKHGLVAGDDKDAMFFPEPVESPAGVRSLAFYHRPMLRLSTVDGHAAIPTLLARPADEREGTRIAYVPLDPVLRDIANLLIPTESASVIPPDGPWGNVKTGAGTPPVRIAEGWFSLYHGVDAIDHGGRYSLKYSAGIVVHDIDRPHLLRYRSPAPVMEPSTVEELRGIVNNVVFPTGIDQRAERALDVYYGMADSRIGCASVKLLSG